MNVTTFKKAVGALSHGVANVWFEPMIYAMARFEINTPLRQAHFLSQIGHESQGLEKMTESFVYTDPERIARIFKSPFDLNNNNKVDPHEIEFAKRYVRNPKALANRAYANRMGNGNEASGDGYRYRGRSPIHLTGKDNYRKASEVVGIDLVKEPDALLYADAGAVVSAWYWQRNGLNILADADRHLDITKRINGGTNGLEDRLKRLAIAKKELGL